MAILDMIRRSGNEALQYNPTVAEIDITTAGSDFLWMVFSVMAATTIGVGVWSAVSVPRGQRVFHHLSMMITATASVAYFCLASDLGGTPITVEFVRGDYANNPVTRSIWYVRYIDWTITTPLLLLELLLVTGLPLSDVVITIFADEVMIVTGLVGALVSSQHKWGLYSIGCVAMFYVFWQLYFPGRQASKALGAELSKAYLVGAGILSFLWFLYPIAWGLADGGNVISPDGEMIFYGILDLLAKPVFAIIHLWALRKVDYSALQLVSGKYSEFTVESQDHNTSSQHHQHNNAPTSTSKMVEKTNSDPAAAPAVAPESTLGGH